MISENEDDVPCLSAETFAILQEFYKEQEEREAVQLVSETGDKFLFNEDWVSFFYPYSIISLRMEHFSNLVNSGMMTKQ